MSRALRDSVFKANLMLPELGLVLFTWGNVSGIDRANGLVYIKPSGLSYEEMTPDDIVVVNLDGSVIQGRRPSSDTATHLALYKAFPSIGGVTHTHSTYATAWAQAQKSLDAFGTTHADTFYGTVPCTRLLTEEEIRSDYEGNTGKLIVETFTERGIDPGQMPAVLTAAHGPFTWGATPMTSVENAAVLEEVAKMAYLSQQLNPQMTAVPAAIRDKHYFRKHGANAYYGPA